MPLDRMMNDPCRATSTRRRAPHQSKGTLVWCAGLGDASSINETAPAQCNHRIRPSVRGTPLEGKVPPSGQAEGHVELEHSQGTTTAEREDERTNTIQPKLTPRPPILSRSSRAHKAQSAAARTSVAALHRNWSGCFDSPLLTGCHLQ